MDESHRYRGDAGARALDELKLVLGLEVTATPFVETAKGPAPFKNVVYDYPLGRAMDDGFVKEPVVVTRKVFKASDYSAERLETLKLEDGLALHEQTKVELATYAAETGRPRVKPFMLVIARDTTHAGQLKDTVEKIHDGRYARRVIQVDSSAKDEEVTRRLLEVEKPEEPTEIVIHVNMLKERLGRHQALHHRPPAGGERPDPGRTVHRPRVAPALRPADERGGRGPPRSACSLCMPSNPARLHATSMSADTVRLWS
ncbi:hypothetical protein [Paracoccus sp. S-4012]|uniref:hypothetical protein n=1 Tax=Paracoccus sp. S-4012 TaxID=2665648 RepID=UPI001E2F55F7|nr:hypothetical protein [Paracoccus sp. S-4012]